jgi:probable rRNA maturation factor
MATVALAGVESSGIGSGTALEALKEIEVSVVSDRAIAEVHVRFMNIEGPTDVITFDHGEIVISAATAARFAREYGQTLEHELALYVIHGLLHLNGYDDQSAGDSDRMKKTQSAILREALERARS